MKCVIACLLSFLAAVESIRESAEITNRFFLSVSAGTMVWNMTAVSSTLAFATRTTQFTSLLVVSGGGDER